MEVSTCGCGSTSKAAQAVVRPWSVRSTAIGTVFAASVQTERTEPVALVGIAADAGIFDLRVRGHGTNSFLFDNLAFNANGGFYELDIPVQAGTQSFRIDGTVPGAGNTVVVMLFFREAIRKNQCR